MTEDEKQPQAPATPVSEPDLSPADLTPTDPDTGAEVSPEETNAEPGKTGQPADS
jgi:hypothetical protein